MRTLSIIIYCLLTVAASLLFLIQGSRRPRFIRFYRSMAEKGPGCCRDSRCPFPCCPTG